MKTRPDGLSARASRRVGRGAPQMPDKDEKREKGARQMGDDWVIHKEKALSRLLKVMKPMRECTSG